MVKMVTATGANAPVKIYKLCRPMLSVSRPAFGAEAGRVRSPGRRWRDLFNASFDVLLCDLTRGRSAVWRQAPVRLFRAQVHIIIISIIIIITIIIITEEPPAFILLCALGHDVNGGVKTGQRGGGKPGQLAAGAKSSTRRVRPGGDGRDFAGRADAA
jgi:hypothetical protein